MEYCPLLHLGVVAIERGAFGLPSTMVANLTFFTYTGWLTITQKQGSSSSDIIKYDHFCVEEQQSILDSRNLYD